MKALALFAAACFVSVAPALAQQTPDRSNSLFPSIGFSAGYAYTYSDERIAEHPVFAVFSELPVSKASVLRIASEYFQTKKNLWPYQIVQQGVTYESQQPFEWKNLSLNVSAIFRVTEKSSVGGGVGIEWIRSYRVVYWPDFVVDPGTNQIMSEQFKRYDIKNEFFRPSLHLLAQSEWEMGPKVVIVPAVFWKLSFVGEQLRGQTPLNSHNSFGAALGLKFVIE